MGLLDDSMFEDSNRMANLQLGLGLLGASSQTGRGIADAFGGAINSHQQSQLMKRKKAHDDMVMQEQQMRMDDYRQGKADRLAQAQQMQQAQQLMNTMGNDYQGMIRAGIPAAMVKERADSMNYGREKVARTGEIAGADGSKMMQDFDAYGVKIGEGQRGYVAPVQVNRGNRIDIVSPQSGQSFTMGQSPDSQASERNASASRDVTMRGQDMVDARMRDGNAVDSGGSSQTGLNKMYGKPQPGYRWKANGDAEFIPGGSADQKAQLKSGGESTVDSIAADLREKYNSLNDSGGIVNDKNNMLSNIAARSGSSSLGQMVGGAVGTENQTARDSVAMTRPLLLQAIMKATGMSAKQMDSNAELKLYLATATDPTKGYQANMEALNRIENLYGSGAKNPKSPNTEIQPTQKSVLKGQVYKGYKFKGGDPSDQNNWEKQ